MSNKFLVLFVWAAVISHTCQSDIGQIECKKKCNSIKGCYDMEFVAEDDFCALIFKDDMTPDGKDILQSDLPALPDDNFSSVFVDADDDEDCGERCDLEPKCFAAEFEVGECKLIIQLDEESASFERDENLERKSAFYRVSLESECLKKCEAFPNCIDIDFYSMNVDYYNCHLITENIPKIDTDKILGNFVSNAIMSIKVKTSQQCKKKCQESPFCNGFKFKKPNCQFFRGGADPDLSFLWFIFPLVVFAFKMICHKSP